VEGLIDGQLIIASYKLPPATVSNGVDTGAGGPIRQQAGQYLPVTEFKWTPVSSHCSTPNRTLVANTSGIQDHRGHSRRAGTKATPHRRGDRRNEQKSIRSPLLEVPRCVT
jgi:hypothetical protein